MLSWQPRRLPHSSQTAEVSSLASHLESQIRESQEHHRGESNLLQERISDLEDLLGVARKEKEELEDEMTDVKDQTDRLNSKVGVWQHSVSEIKSFRFVASYRGMCFPYSALETFRWFGL